MIEINGHLAFKIEGEDVYLSPKKLNDIEKMRSLKNPENNKKDRMEPSSSVIGALTSSEITQSEDILNQDTNISSIDLDDESNNFSNANEQNLLFDHNEQLRSFINELNLKFSKTSSLSSKEQSNYLFSLINNITGDLISMNSPDLFKVDSSSNERSINQVFKNLSFGLFIAYNTLQDKNQKYQSRIQDLQKQCDELSSVSTQKNNSGSANSNINYDKEYCENNESLLKTMTSKFDELTDEMHKLSLKNSDQERSIERLKQEKMDLELQIDLLAKQLKLSQENSELKSSQESSQLKSSQENSQLKSSQENSQLKSSQENTQKNTAINSSDNISIKSPSSNEEPVVSDARLLVLQNDISALSIKVQQLNASNDKKKEKIKMLVKIVKDKDSKLQDAQKNIEALQIKYDKLSIENDEKEDRLKSINKEITSKIDVQSSRNSEIENFNKALNELSVQMQEMNQEIQFECKAKNSLYAVTQQQQQLLVKQEQYINVLTDKIQSLEEKNMDIESQLTSNSPFSNKVQQKDFQIENNSESLKNLEDKIMLILYEKFDDDNYNNNLFLNQIKEELKKQNRRNKQEDSILCITKILISKIISLTSPLQSNLPLQLKDREINLFNNNSNTNEQVQRLLNYISNLLHFIDQIANSGEVQDWIIGTNPQEKESFRQDLLKQCARIDSFLKQNYYYEYMESNIGNHEEEEEDQNGNENIEFDDADFLKISEKAIKQIFNENQPLNEIAVVFKMFVSSNDFLRRFSEELKLQNDSLISDLHGIRKEIAGNIDEQTPNEVPIQDQQSRDNDNDNLSLNPNNMVKLNNYLRAIYQSLSNQKVTRATNSHKNSKNKKNKNSNNNTNDNDDEYDYSDYGYEYDYEDPINNHDLIQIREMIKKCLEMINDNQNQSPSSKSKKQCKSQQPYIDGYMVKYVSKLEKKVHKLEEINGKLYQKIKALKSAQNKQKKQFEEEVQGNKKCNEDLSSTIIDKDKSLSELETLVDHKNEEINLLKMRIKENEKKFYENIENLKKEIQIGQNESQDRIKTLKNSNNNDMLKLKQDYDDKIQALNNKINDNKTQFKSEIKKIQAEYDSEVQRSNELKEHFESLICDLKNKLQDSRDREKNEKDEKLKASRDIADLKAELSRLRIENKMMSMKLQTNEEKFNRERELKATQNRMAIVKLEADKEKEIKEIKEASSMNFHKFIRHIFEIFNEFIIPNSYDNQAPPKLTSKSFSKENALSLMNRVNDIAKQAERFSKENAEYQFQFNEIKEILMINNSDDDDEDNEENNDCKKIRKNFIKIIQALKEINNNNSNLKSVTKKQKQNDPNNMKRYPVVTARDWEVWARRLHALATDSFCTMKPAKDLQQVIEEELVSAVGQRPLFRKVEILRSEKLLLQRGLNYVAHNELNERNIKTINNLVPIPSSGPINEKKAMNQNSLSIIQILAVVVSVRRMQKLSGHLKLYFGIGSKNQNQKTTAPNSFVINRNINRNNDDHNETDDEFDNNESRSGSNNDSLPSRAKKSSDKKRFPILNYVD